MADYTVRVQLMGNPTADEYEQLHQSMSQLGFARTVKGSTRVVELPHGLYFGSSDGDAAVVRTAVTAKAKAIQSKIKVFVAETDDWASHG